MKSIPKKDQTVEPNLSQSDDFSKPKHEWLQNYRPYPIKEIEDQKEEVISEAPQKVQELKKTIESLADQYSWMDQLLCAQDDDFAEAAAKALEFLGFEVQRTDNQLAPGQRRREDLHVIDRSDSLTSPIRDFSEHSCVFPADTP